jgi:hypothetical protein
MIGAKQAMNSFSSTAAPIATPSDGFAAMSDGKQGHTKMQSHLIISWVKAGLCVQLHMCCKPDLLHDSCLLSYLWRYRGGGGVRV